MGYRKRIYYTDADRELMWDRWQAGESLHSIARLFGRHHPSIQGILARAGGIRPPKRNGGRRRYRANTADKAAWDRAHRPKPCKLAQNPVLARLVAEKLPLLEDLTSGRERRYNFIHRQRNLPNVLRRPVETALRKRTMN